MPTANSGKVGRGGRDTPPRYLSCSGSAGVLGKGMKRSQSLDLPVLAGASVRTVQIAQARSADAIAGAVAWFGADDSQGVSATFDAVGAFAGVSVAAPLLPTNALASRIPVAASRASSESAELTDSSFVQLCSAAR